jgi:hypothetical protein
MPRFTVRMTQAQREALAEKARRAGASARGTPHPRWADSLRCPREAGGLVPDASTGHQPHREVLAGGGLAESAEVVGVDEKYMLVPKNDKPEGEMKGWMYVYFAVDCYTYDLLHIEIYPYNTQQSARAFLLALRAKGYRPRVIVTDVRVDYRGLVAQVFPEAVHHECLFHALQQVREHVKGAYGTNYFTPFSDDAQERIQGQCPLELAGYEVQKLPMAQLFRGLALQWPASAFQELVPNM